MKKVKIGPITYHIRKVKRLVQHQKSMYGVVSYGKGYIKITKGLTKKYDRLTLWHEVIHAILIAASIEEHDEKMIDIIAHGIMQVINDNPEIGRKV